jgi:hypothetical protein
MKRLKRRVHWSGVVGLLTTVCGVLASPEVAGVLPRNVSLAVVFLGAGIQAITRAVHKGDVREIPKP